MTFYPHYLTKPLFFILFASLLLALPGPHAFSQTQQDGQVQATSGVLKCDVAAGFTFIFGSTRELECVYTPNEAPAQFYKGKISKFGLDIGFLQSGVILWTVITPTVPIGDGALQGTYVGVSAEAAVVAGLGANVLVGVNKVQLNPLSISGVQGLNVAVGIASLELTLIKDPVFPAQ